MSLQADDAAAATLLVCSDQTLLTSFAPCDAALDALET